MLREYRSVDSKAEIQTNNNESKMTSYDYFFFLPKSRLKTHTFHDAQDISRQGYKLTNDDALITNKLLLYSNIL